MLYTPLTKKAMQIAFDAHKDQKDKSGLPYIFHPMHLAEQMTTEEATCVALLHDVVEDTSVTFADLETIFPTIVVNSLRLLTHDKNTPYLEYIQKIKGDEIATAVKLADLYHNSDLSRLDPTDADMMHKGEYRIRTKYQPAIDILTAP